MKSWIFASILAACVLSSAECTFIVLTCGPFWVDPGLFLKTWLYYAALAALGIAYLGVVGERIPFLRRRFENPRKRFFFYFNLAWIVGAALLVALVAADSYAGSEYLMLALIAALAGVLSSFLLRRTVKTAKSIPKGALLLSLCSFLLTNSVYLISSWYFSSAVSQRSAAFRGDVPHACLLIMDTARSDHFSCYGYPFQTTPNIDQLAQEGLLCRNAYSAANWTPPGHISIFTGKYPAQHGNNGKVYMPDDLLSLTEVLNQQGYYCMAMYNNPTAGRSMNLTQGFDSDIGVYGHSWVYPAPFRLWDKLIYRDSGAKITFHIAERAFKWVEKRGGHLFLYVNITEPHAPYRIHEPYFSQFTAARNLKRMPDLRRVQNLCSSLDLVLNDSAKFAGCSPEGYAYIRAAYDSEIAYADHQLGQFADHLRILKDRLKDASLLDQTLLVITSDHGEFLGEHQTLGHPELLFNPVLNIPLIMRYPEAIKPAVDSNYVSNVDIFPTVLSLMDLVDRIPADVRGYNILAGEPPVDRSLLSANISPEGGCYSLIQGDYKLILNSDNFLPKYFPHDTLLFNLRDDPHEVMDLHASVGGPRDEMARQLNDWIAEIAVRPRGDVEMSRDALANLKALGYVR